MKKQGMETATKDKLVTFRIPNDEYEVLKEIAELQCRTVSNCIRYTLRDIIMDYKENKNTEL